MPSKLKEVKYKQLGRRLIALSEVADCLSLSRKTTRRLLDRAGVPAYLLSDGRNGSIRYGRDDVEVFLSEHRFGSGFNIKIPALRVKYIQQLASVLMSKEVSSLIQWLTIKHEDKMAEEKRQSLIHSLPPGQKVVHRGSRDDSRRTWLKDSAGTVIKHGQNRTLVEFEGYGHYWIPMVDLVPAGDNFRTKIPAGFETDRSLKKDKSI